MVVRGKRQGWTVEQSDLPRRPYVETTMKALRVRRSATGAARLHRRLQPGATALARWTDGGPADFALHAGTKGLDCTGVIGVLACSRRS